LVVLAVIVASFGGCTEAKKTDEATPSNTVKTSSGLEMVYIPAGEFSMGVSEGPIDAKPAHLVKLDSFLMDQTEVTQAVYEKLMGTNP